MTVCKKNEYNVPVDSASPQIPKKPLRLCSQRCSVRSTHSAQESKARISPSRCKRCQRVSRDSQIFKYPPFCKPLILVVARFEMQHDAVVNHVYMSKQLCQAESECPLLVRERFRSSSNVVTIMLWWYDFFFLLLLLMKASLHYSLHC